MLTSLEAVLEIVLRSTVVYIVILLGFRLAGKRHVSQLSLIDFALVLLVSNAVQNAMVGTDSSVLGGVVAAFTLIIINVLLTKLVNKDKPLGRLFEGEARILVRHGKVITGALEHEDISEDELEAAIREHGIQGLNEVATAILEVDGSISVIAHEGGGTHREHNIGSLPHRRRARHNLSPGA